MNQLQVQFAEVPGWVRHLVIHTDLDVTGTRVFSVHGFDEAKNRTALLGGFTCHRASGLVLPLPPSSQDA